MGKHVLTAVRELCLWFPQASEKRSHGAPGFFVGGRVFAMFALNHHGDGRIALWLPAPAGAQAHWVEQAAQHYFVPPYVGPRGWLGVQLDRGLAWNEVAARVREAYAEVAPRRLVEHLPVLPQFRPPDADLDPEQIDPLRSPRGRTIQTLLRGICLALPETSEGEQFGSPVWRAGKKTFAGLHAREDGFEAQCWVGAERQSMLIEDPRYRVPPYIGHNGWIGLELGQHVDHQELTGLIHDSYRHFALKRMLKALGAA